MTEKGPSANGLECDGNRKGPQVRDGLASKVNSERRVRKVAKSSSEQPALVVPRDRRHASRVKNLHTSVNRPWPVGNVASAADSIDATRRKIVNCRFEKRVFGMYIAEKAEGLQHGFVTFG